MTPFAPQRLILLASLCLLEIVSRGSPVRSAEPDSRRGDSNGDGPVDIADAVATLGFLFQGGGLVACLDAADANDDGEVSLTDPTATLGMLFLGAPAHPAPGADDVSDVDQDGHLRITDAVAILNYLYRGG
jgi:hypothetical protein